MDVSYITRKDEPTLAKKGDLNLKLQSLSNFCNSLPGKSLM